MAVEPFDQHEPGRVFSNRYINDSYKVIVGMTTREKGVSLPPFAHFNMGFHVQDELRDVLTNRELLASDLSVSLSNWIVGEQVHANRLFCVSQTEAGRGAFDLDTAIPDVDGLYTSETGLMLAACFADCVPIFFIAHDGSMVGIAHAGWKGTVGEIGGRMIEKWRDEFGISPDSIDVIIGPSIGSCCYEVDDRVAQEIRKLSGIEQENLAVPTRAGHYQLNLQLTNRRILEKYGVLSSNIYTSNFCTSCRTDLFYSHRKENGKTGRMFGYICIEMK